MFHCRLCRGAEGGEAGWRVAVNEYMHTSFTEASFTVYVLSDVFTVYRWTMALLFSVRMSELSTTQRPLRPSLPRGHSLGNEQYRSQTCDSCSA